VKRRRFHVELSEEQQLALTILLVILVVISMLYCLGFASLALRDTWEDLHLPWNETSLPQPDTGMLRMAPTGMPSPSLEMGGLSP
jgi:hypothetical protein